MPGGPSPRIAGSVNRTNLRHNQGSRVSIDLVAAGSIGEAMRHEPESLFSILTILSILLACGSVMSALTGYAHPPAALVAILFGMFAVIGISGQRACMRDDDRREREDLQLRAKRERKENISRNIVQWLREQDYASANANVEIGEVMEGVSDNREAVVVAGVWIETLPSDPQFAPAWRYTGFLAEVAISGELKANVEITDAVFVQPGRISFLKTVARRAAISRRPLLAVVRSDFASDVELDRPFLA